MKYRMPCLTSKVVYRLSWHCFVTRYVWSDCRREWAIARLHIAAPWVICTMMTILVQMDEAGCTTQNEKSSIWIVTTVQRPTSEWEVNILLVQYTINLPSVHTWVIPRIAIDSSSEDGKNDLQGKQWKESAENYFGLIVHCPYTENHYDSGHHQSWFSKRATGQPTIGCTKKEKEWPSAYRIDYATLKEPTIDDE